MRVQLLTELPGLARRLPRDDVRSATAALNAASVELPEGRWDPPMGRPAGHLGFLVLGGLLIREICIGRDWSSELLGEGDVLRPWLEDSASFVEARWEVLEPTRLAVLDATVAKQLARYTPLLENLLERALERSRSMAVHAVIEGVHRIDERLLLLLWHMAERFGHRENGHIVMPIQLTHEHLARLVGARRPTVTTALGKLETAGRIARAPGGTWIVQGDPPK
jgi:hypothetical protein